MTNKAAMEEVVRVFSECRQIIGAFGTGSRVYHPEAQEGASNADFDVVVLVGKAEKAAFERWLLALGAYVPGKGSAYGSWYLPLKGRVVNVIITTEDHVFTSLAFATNYVVDLVRNNPYLLRGEYIPRFQAARAGFLRGWLAQEKSCE